MEWLNCLNHRFLLNYLNSVLCAFANPNTDAERKKQRKRFFSIVIQFACFYNEYGTLRVGSTRAKNF